MSEPVESTLQIEYRYGSGNLQEDYRRDIVFYIFIVLYFYIFIFCNIKKKVGKASSLLFYL